MSPELFSQINEFKSSLYTAVVSNVTYFADCESSNCESQLDNITTISTIRLNGNDNDDVQEDALPLWLQVSWSLFFALMILIATGGNIIVIFIVITTRRMRTVTNYFIVNLCIADTMLSTFNVIFNFMTMLSGNWLFGETYCRISNFIAIVSVAASVFTLSTISLDRHTAIIYPLRPRMPRSRALTIMACIWLLSAALSSPNLYFSRVKYENYASGEFRTICYIHWPDGPSNESRMDYVYNVIILLVTYFLPIVLMIATYCRVGLKLWGSRSIGEITPKQISNIKSKRKIVKMMVVVVVIFAVCWLPYHIYFLLLHHMPEIIETENVQHIYLAIYWLAMSNAMYNPMIYCWMNKRFRRGFRNVFMCSCRSEEDDQNMSQAGANAGRRRTRYSVTGDVTPYSTSTDQSANNLRVRGSNAQSLSVDTCLELSNASSSRKASPRTTPARNRSNTLMV